MSSAITVYEHTGFKGKSKGLGLGEYPSASSIVGNDKISSIKVSPGYYCYVYADSGFRSTAIPLFQGEYQSLPGWNDRISSIKVFEHKAKFFPLVEFYSDANYKGTYQSLAGTGPDTGFSMPFFKNDSISSMKIPEGVKVILYSDSEFRGSQQEFKAGNYDNLKTYGWNDKISSVKILSPGLELVHIEYLEEVRTPNGNPIALSSSTINESDITQNASLTLSRELTESSSRSWSNSTMIGLSVSTTTKVGASGAVLSAEVSTTISATLENTFTIGEEESNSETLTFAKTLNMDIPPHSIGSATIMLTPQRYRVRVRYTFEIAGTGEQTTQDAEIIVEAYHKGEAVIDTEPIMVFA